MAIEHHGVVEQRRELRVEHGAAELHRRCVCRLDEQGEPGLTELDAARSLFARGHRRLDLEHGFRQESRDGVDRGRVLDHDLRQSGAVAEEDEGQPRKAALVVEPAAQPHALA